MYPHRIANLVRIVMSGVCPGSAVDTEVVIESALPSGTFEI